MLYIHHEMLLLNIWTLCVLFLVLSQTNSAEIQDKFYKVADFAPSGDLYIEIQTRSTLQCALACNSHSQCVAASMVDNGGLMSVCSLHGSDKATGNIAAIRKTLIRRGNLLFHYYYFKLMESASMKFVHLINERVFIYEHF